MAQQSITDLVNNLPKPETLEEQYVYALVCSAAGVEPKYGVAANAAFKRMDQFWRAFWLVVGEKLTDLERPAANTVDSAAIQNSAIVTLKLSDGAVTLAKIDSNVADRLWAVDRTGEVTTYILHDSSVTTAKVEDSAVTTPKIADGSITYDKLDDFLKGKIDDIDDGIL